MNGTYMERAQRYFMEEILANQSMLVGYLLQHADEDSPFSWDDVENLFPDVDNMDNEELLAYLEDELGQDPLDFGEQEDLDDEYSAVWDDIRTHIGDHGIMREVYEWWLVSKWLCGELHAQGEVVIDVACGQWWGRCGTGQAIIMDGILQKIAEDQD